jgi:hypothetical protein
MLIRAKDTEKKHRVRRQRKVVISEGRGGAFAVKTAAHFIHDSRIARPGAMIFGSQSWPPLHKWKAAKELV